MPRTYTIRPLWEKTFSEWLPTSYKGHITTKHLIDPFKKLISPSKRKNCSQPDYLSSPSGLNVNCKMWMIALASDVSSGIVQSSHCAHCSVYWTWQTCVTAARVVTLPPTCPIPCFRCQINWCHHPPSQLSIPVELIPAIIPDIVSLRCRINTWHSQVKEPDIHLSPYYTFWKIISFKLRHNTSSFINPQDGQRPLCLQMFMKAVNVPKSLISWCKS